MLCASILLAPLSLAMSLSDFHYDVGVGQKCVTLGDPTDNKTTIFGTQENNISIGDIEAGIVLGDNGMELNGDGIARSVGYCAPVVTGALGFKITKSFKVSTELHVSSSNKIYMNDVVSNVSGIAYRLTTDGANVINDGDAPNVFPARATVTVEETLGGKNDLYVEPKFGIAFKAEYQFGADTNGATIGLAVARAADEFTYNADVLSEAGRGSDEIVQVNIGSKEHTDYEINPAQGAQESSYHLKGDGAANTTEKYDEAGFWVGAVASASAEITESVLLKLGAGYYMRDFDASKNDSNGVHFLVSSTKSAMSIFSVSVTMAA